MSARARLLAFAPWAAATLLVAAGTHLVAILAMPALAPRDAHARFVQIAPRAATTPLPPARPGREIAPFNDPAMATAVCRYDLADGPFRLRASVSGEEFVSFSFHSRGNAIYYALTDRAAFRAVIDVLVGTQEQIEAIEAAEEEDAPAEETRLVSPTREGFVYLRSLAPLPTLMDEAAARLAAVECAVEPF